MTVFLILTGIAAVVFAVLFFSLKRGIREAACQMEKLNEESDSNQQLTCAMPSHELERLLRAVNVELSQKRGQQIHFQRKEKELRKQISNISHDLRTPLTSILGYVELLEDAAAESAERREYLQIIERRAKALQELIGGFYDLSRMDGNEYELRLTPVNLHHILCSGLAMFYTDFQRLGFEVDVVLDEDVPLVAADEAAVTRVFSNLLQNILAHGTGAAEIRLERRESGCVTIFRNQTDEISKEELPRVFDRFFTADEMRTGQNTGLGLTITKKFVESMGHEITASLEEDGELAIFQIEINWGMLK